MLIPIDDLTTPLTSAQIKASIYSVAAAFGVPVTSWRPGAVLRTVITACSIILAALSALIALIARSGFISTAEGDWARINASEIYGVTPPAATYATTTIRVSNASGAAYGPLAPGDFRVKNSVTHKTYRNTATVSIGSLASNVPVAIIADEAGSASTAVPGEISQLVTVFLGLSVTNPDPAVGTDAIETEDLRELCTDRLGALSPNGPEDAYRYIAKTTLRPDGSNVGVTRVFPLPDEMGGLDVYLATAAGVVPAPDVVLVNEALQRNCVPLCVTCRTHSAAAATVHVTYTVWALNDTGLTVAETRDAIENALVKHFAQLPIGGYEIGVERRIYRSDLIGAIKAATTEAGLSLKIIRVDLASPATDVNINVGGVPVLGVITPTINQIRQPTL